MLKKVFFLINCVFVSSIIHAQQSERPNILWIVSEDNSPFIGAYGDRAATTPHIDSLASQGLLFKNAYCTAAVCAPSRSTLITGMYPASVGTENMRSTFPVPDFVKFFPRYLREAGYYTTNNAKKDYNTVDQIEAWDESSKTATYKNRKPGQPFFAVFNIEISHESAIFDRDKIAAFFGKRNVGNQGETTEPKPGLRHNPDSIHIPAYLPLTAEMKHDWALYYDKIQDMDQRVGELLDELDRAGLADNTIVFYYGDNGGVLGRSKRFMFESGLRIPLVVRFPKKYQYLNPYTNSTVVDRFVDFADFAPTILNLAEIPIPNYLQGKPFLGKKVSADSKNKEIVFGSRARMDERFDLVRTIRKGNLRYVRNFMPHRPYGQHLNFLWLASSMQSWENAYKSGQLNEVQSRFFKQKPVEELYNVVEDPDNVVNLATDPAYAGVLDSMRTETFNYILSLKDVGFIPEGAVEDLTGSTTLYDYARSGKYNFSQILDLAYKASSRDKNFLPELLAALDNPDPTIRYWGAVGLLILDDRSESTKRILIQHLQDAAPYVRLTLAEASYKLGYTPAAKTIGDELHHANKIIRLQALNTLEMLPAKELLPYKSVFEQIVQDGSSEYEVNVAKHLLNTKF